MTDFSLKDANRLLRHLRVKRTAEALLGLVGVVGLHLLAIEAQR